MDVDIIVLTCNALDVTKKFIDMLYKHTPTDQFNLLIIDNGSKKETVEYIKKLRKTENNVHIFLSFENLGVARGRNLGFEYRERYDLNSELILFLDNDQLVGEGWLDHHISVLNRGYDLIGVEAWKMTRNFQPLYQITKIDTEYSYVGGGGLLMKDSVYNRVGKFDNRFSPIYFEDPDYILRSNESGFKIGWNVTAKIIHLAHKTMKTMDQSYVRSVYKKNLAEFRKKWNGKNMPKLKQVDLPEFKTND